MLNWRLARIICRRTWIAPVLVFVLVLAQPAWGYGLTSAEPFPRLLAASDQAAQGGLSQTDLAQGLALPAWFELPDFTSAAATPDAHSVARAVSVPSAPFRARLGDIPQPRPLFQTVLPSLSKHASVVTATHDQGLTYTLVFTIPAGATISDVTLSDRLPDYNPRIRVIADSADDPNPISGPPVSAEVTYDDYNLTWRFMDDIVNPESEPYVYEATYRARVDYYGVHRSDIGVNQAELRWNGGSASASANVTIVTPKLQLKRHIYTADGEQAETGTGDRDLLDLRSGEIITVSIWVTNVADIWASPAYNVQVLDSLPIWIDYVEMIAGPEPAVDTWRSSTRVRWTAQTRPGGTVGALDVLNIGEVFAVTYRGRVVDGVAPGHSFFRNTEADYTFLPPISGRSATATSADIQFRTPDIVVIKRAEGRSSEGTAVVQGDIVTYTIVYTFPAGTTVYPVTRLQDQLDDGLRFMGAASWSEDDGTPIGPPSVDEGGELDTVVQWVITPPPSFATDVRHTYMITAQVSPTFFLGSDAGIPVGQGRRLDNEARLFWLDEAGASLGSNTAVASVRMRRPAFDPIKWKEAPIDEFEGAGIPVRFELRDIQNIDSVFGAVAYNVSVTDTLPVGWRYDGSAPLGNAITINGRTVITWGSVISLPVSYYMVGESPTPAAYVITATPPVTVVAGASYSNVVEVGYNNVQGYRFVDRDDLVMTLPPDVFKDVTPSSPFSVGQVVTYTLIGVVPPNSVLYWPRHRDLLPAGVHYTGRYAATGGVLLGPPITSIDSSDRERITVRWRTINNASNEPVTFTVDLETVLRGRDTDGTLVWRSYSGATGILNDATLQWSTTTISTTYMGGQTAQRRVYIIQPYLVDGNWLPDKTLVNEGAEVFGGDLVTYSFSIYNTGRASAYDVVINDQLPEVVEFVGYTASMFNQWSGETYVPTFSAAPSPGDTGLIKWVVDKINPNHNNNSSLPTQLVLTYSVRISDSVGVGAKFTNSAWISDYSSLPGDQPFERHYAYLAGAGDQAEPVSVPKAEIGKRADVNGVPLGGNVVFTLTVPETPLAATMYNVTVTDKLSKLSPGSLHALAATAPGNSFLDVTSDTVSVGYSAILPNSQATVIITGRVPFTTVEDLVQNDATVYWQDAAFNGNTYSATSSAVGVAVIAPEISVTKDAPGAASPGAYLEYIIAYENGGLDTAHNVRLTDTLPVSVTYVGFDHDPPVALVLEESGRLVWDLSDLSPGESGIISVTAAVWPTATPGSSLVNTVAIGTSSTGDEPGNNQDTVTTTVESTVLKIAKTATPDPVRAGGELLYTLVVTNTGSETVHNLVIVDGVPLGTTFVDASPGGVFGGGGVTWSPTDLGSGEQRVVTFTVRADSGLVSGTQIVNDIYGAVAENALPTPVAAPVVVTVHDARLAISKIATPNPVPAGGLLYYTITVENLGDVEAAGVVVTDRVPINTTFSGASQGGRLTPDGVVTWPPDDIGVGGQKVVTFAVRVDAVLAAGTQIVNDAYGAMSSNAPSPSSEPVSVAVYSAPVLSIEKTAAETTSSRENLVYTILCRNIGSAVAYNVRITESYDGNIVVTGADPSPDVGNNVWRLDQLMPNADYTIVVTGQVRASIAEGSWLTNTVMIDSDETEPQSDSVSTRVTGYLLYLPIVVRGYSAPPPSVGINLVVQRIQVSPTLPTVGEATRISVTLRNLGTGTVTEDFWVDLYVDPTETPTLNVLWHHIAPYGKAWLVHEDIPGGGTLVIHTDQPDDATDPGSRYSNWPGWFVSAGEHVLYVQVDSFGPTTGFVSEEDETDNVNGPLPVTVAPGDARIVTFSPVQWQEWR